MATELPASTTTTDSRERGIICSRVRVLIVDDNVEFLTTARRLLEHEGMLVVDVATTGAEALHRAEEHDLEVILVDVDLGEESGFDVVESLSAVPELGCPMVLLSAHSEEDLVDLLQTSSAVGFLAKSSLNAREIIELVNSAK